MSPSSWKITAALSEIQVPRCKPRAGLVGRPLRGWQSLACCADSALPSCQRSGIWHGKVRNNIEKAKPCYVDPQLPLQPSSEPLPDSRSSHTQIRAGAVPLHEAHPYHGVTEPSPQALTPSHTEFATLERCLPTLQRSYPDCVLGHKPVFSVGPWGP